MDRRTALGVLGSAFAVSLSGCSGGSDGARAGENGGSGQQSTATPSPTSSPTPTASPTPEGAPTHEIGERFQVGDGAQAIEYTIKSASTANRIGSGVVGEDASGVFVIVIMTLTNVGNESIDVSTNPYQLTDEQGRLFDPDAGTGAYLSADDRIDAEPITFTQLQPGLKTEGALVFDVVPGAGYGLVISPAGVFSNAKEHLVPLGTAGG